MNKRLQKMIDENIIPNMEGVFIDAYNQSVNEEIAGTITTRVDASNMSFVTEPKIIERDTPMKGNYTEPIIIDDYNQRVPQDQEVIGTVTTQFGDSATRHGYKIAEPILDGVVSDPCVKNPLKGKSDRGWHFEQQVYDETGITRTVKSGEGSGNIPKVIENSTSYRIRKLTPRECFRLMGVTEADIDKIQQSGISNCQQYKMAGNSIVVDVLYYIFKNMFLPEASNKADNNGQLRLF